MRSGSTIEIGVELHRTQMAQYAPHPATPVGRAQQPLGAQRDPARLVGGERGLGGAVHGGPGGGVRHARHRSSTH
ncbi:hypothetical protein SANTM175S_01064 [Streptomyces antimycoticus]